MLDKFIRVEELNERKRLHCINCRRITIHSLEARCEGSWDDPESQESGAEQHSIFRCGACDTVCYESSSWSSYDIDHDEYGNSYYPKTSTQFPAPISAHFDFNTESTPGRLDVILEEMLYSLAGNKMTLATIGLRLAVEFIVNDKKCAGKTLKLKIDDLRKQDFIDDDQKDLLHRIRKRGNAGAHEAVGMTASELVAAMSIIEGLLEKLYNGPARHEATIRKAKQLLKDDDAP